MSPENFRSQDVVTAVIVAHDGAAWIPHVAHAVASQSRPVQRVVAVDTGSRDRSGAMLAQAFGRGSVFGMDRGTGYGAAVAKALRHRAANTYLPPPPGGPPAERTEWVWLLHDDCEPGPDALEQLLLGAGRSPAAAVLGPKLLDWSDRGVLLEAGTTIDRAGRRITGIEPREVDQGQHDGDRDVLAVSSAGMLIRRDVWDQVDGFDPSMRLFRDDADLCWRVQAAGYRVRVVTDAVVYHVGASARNRRSTSAAPRRRREDRRNGLITLLGNLPAGPMFAALAGNLVLSALRTLFFLLAKRPGAALDECTAYLSVAAHPLRLRTARQHRAPGRQAAYARLRNELPPGRSFRKLAEFAMAALSKSLPVDTVGSHHATEDPSDDDSLLVDTGLAQRLLTSPGALLFLGLTTIALVAERSLLGTTPIGGGALVPAWGGVSGLWQEYLQGFHPAGIGTAASAPPYVAVVALLATLLGGKPWLAVDVILLGSVPLAGVTAYLATRRVTRFVPARIWAAATYALLPAGMGAVAGGRLGTAVVLVLLPLAMVLAGRALTGPRRRARRAAWAAALVVAVAAAFVPLVWLLVLTATAVAVAAFGRGRRAALLNAGIIVAAPLALLMPWTIDLASHPARLFLEAGVARPGLASSRLAVRSVLLLSPGGPGLPPFWVTAGLVLAAALALVASGRRAMVLAGWAVAAIGLIVAAAVTRVTVTPAGAAFSVPAWPGAALAIAAAGMLLAAVAAAERVPGRLRSGRWRSPQGLALVAAAVVACSAPVLAAAAWVASGVRGPVAPAPGPLVPEFVTVASDTGLRPRTLVLQACPGGAVCFTVLRGSDPLLGSGELAMPAAGQRVLNQAVAALAAPNGGDVLDQGRALASLGIGFVLLPAPVSPGLARLLDGVPGLRPVSVTAAFRLWRLADTAARVTVAERGGAVVPIPSGPVDVTGAKAPPAGGTLVLAEPAGGWSATLNGRPLTPVRALAGGWAQGFRLPPGGGSLSIGHNDTGRRTAVALECLAVLVVAALGLPGAKVAGEEADRSRERRAARRGAGVPVPAAARSAAVREPAVREPAVREPAVREPAVRQLAGGGFGYPRDAPGRQGAGYDSTDRGDQRPGVDASGRHSGAGAGGRRAGYRPGRHSGRPVDYEPARDSAGPAGYGPGELGDRMPRRPEGYYGPEGYDDRPGGYAEPGRGRGGRGAAGVASPLGDQPGPDGRPAPRSRPRHGLGDPRYGRSGGGEPGRAPRGAPAREGRLGRWLGRRPQPERGSYVPRGRPPADDASLAPLAPLPPAPPRQQRAGDPAGGPPPGWGADAGHDAEERDW